MKSGTSTLHYILNEHPDIFIPKNELAFFDIDNILQHSDFNFFSGNHWFSQQIEDAPSLFWQWYSSHFDGAADGQILGEDSTTYLASEVAAKRIQLQKKEVKTLVMLRHPTSRAYSQYWHMVRTGRAMYSLEDTIRFEPHSILGRSLYRDQLRNFLEHIPRERVKIIILEEFLTSKRDSLREICDYLGVDCELLPESAIDAHKNKGLIPKYPAIQMSKNRFFRELGNQTYSSRLPVKPELTPGSKVKLNVLRTIDRVHHKLNPLREEHPPEIKASTQKFLDDFFKRELDGINDLLGKDVMSIWFGRNS
jgi:hypothetical protein